MISLPLSIAILAGPFIHNPAYSSLVCISNVSPKYYVQQWIERSIWHSSWSNVFKYWKGQHKGSISTSIEYSQPNTKPEAKLSQVDMAQLSNNRFRWLNLYANLRLIQLSSISIGGFKLVVYVGCLAYPPSSGPYFYSSVFVNFGFIERRGCGLASWFSERWMSWSSVESYIALAMPLIVPNNSHVLANI